MRLFALLSTPSLRPPGPLPATSVNGRSPPPRQVVVALDNVSTIPEWLCDALCRAVTGDGLTSRALYCDADVSVLSFRRVLAMTSIDAGALRGDLGERLLPIELQVIDPGGRRPDADIAADFTTAAPELLGALLDVLAAVLDALPKVDRTKLPRMADFARLLHALDDVTEWSTVDDDAGTAADVAETVIDSDPVAVAIRDVVAPGHSWTGTAAVLLEKITPDRPPKGWPRSPRAIAGVVKRITPALRAVGVTVEHSRDTNAARARKITLTRAADDANLDSASEPSEPSEHRSDQCQRSDG